MVSDIGVPNIDASAIGMIGEHSEDSFERYYNKDLDLDEGIYNITWAIKNNFYRLSTSCHLWTKWECY